MAREFFQYVLFGIGMVCFLLTGIKLILNGKTKHDKGMMYLGGSFLLMNLAFIFWGFRLSNYLVIYTFLFFAYLGINFFTRNTFYSNQKSKFVPISIATSITYVLLMIPHLLKETGIVPDFVDSLFGRYLDNILSLLFAGFVFGWLAVSAYNSLQQLKQASIQPWILKRIQIVLISSILAIFISLPDLINVMTNNGIKDVMTYTQLFITFFFMVTQYFAWVMPPVFKDYLNRGYIPPKIDEIDLAEEEIMKMMEEDYSE
jgi:hypothetical protein